MLDKHCNAVSILGLISFRMLGDNFLLNIGKLSQIFKEKYQWHSYISYVSLQVKRSVCGTSCSVCLERKPPSEMKALLCSHFFCKECWSKQFEVLINNGIAAGEWLIKDNVSFCPSICLVELTACWGNVENKIKLKKNPNKTGREWKWTEEL